jgi:hypothetical protein
MDEGRDVCFPSTTDMNSFHLFGESLHVFIFPSRALPYTVFPAGNPKLWLIMEWMGRAIGRWYCTQRAEDEKETLAGLSAPGEGCVYVD